MSFLNDQPGRRFRGSPRAEAGARSLRERLETLGHIVRLARQVWRTSRLLTVLSIGFRLLRAVQPVLALYAGKLIIDEVVKQIGQPPPGPALADWLASGRLTLLGEYLGFEFALVIANDILTRATSLVDGILAEKHSHTVSIELMEHAAALDLKHFESADYQDRLERARRVAGSGSSVLPQLLGQGQDVITVISLAAGLVLYAPWLIVLLLLSIVPAVIGETRFNTWSYWMNWWRSAERRELNYLRNVGASPETAKEVKLFALGDYLITRFRQLSDTIFAENTRLAVRRAFWGGLLSALGTLAYYGAYAYIAWRTVAGNFTVGDLTFLAGSFLRLYGLFQKILLGFTQIASQSLSLDDLFSFFAIEPAILSPKQPLPFPSPIQKGIQFEDVGFRYPDTEHWAVRNLSIAINAGESVALVGENGAGKTTIVKLLTRLYDPDEGRILIDGIDLRDFSIDEVRSHIGVIFQDFVRYSFTAAENIGIGRVEAIPDRPRIVSSAERSLAAPVIDRLPLAYEQPLGRQFAGGRDLSGGEWQKIALARAYMREADFIILDEPTAALDAKAEAAVFQRFKALAAGRTALLISHRFSTVRMADRIIVLADGRILESGTHEELLARRGTYAELFELQASGYR
jgi:ATP-binding cassette subfamily B protein